MRVVSQERTDEGTLQGKGITILRGMPLPLEERRRGARAAEGERISHSAVSRFITFVPEEKSNDSFFVTGRALARELTRIKYRVKSKQCIRDVRSQRDISKAEFSAWYP